MTVTETKKGDRTLRIDEHTVHRVDRLETPGNSEGMEQYIISTLKTFELGVELLVDGARASTHAPIPLTLTLVYESGKPVEQVGDIPLLTGTDGRGMLSAGRVGFQLKVTALSSLRQQQRFRIRVAAPDVPGILSVYSEPFRTLSKLFRSPPAPKRDAAAAGLDAPEGRTCMALMALLQADVDAMKGEIATLKSQVAMLAPE